MSYELNPHKHVKIWLTLNPDVFLNQENQLRLLSMRVKNPDDIIHLVYAKKLLSEKALRELNDFCSQHNITPVSIEDEILPKCMENEHERALVAIYEREINALNAGGNVAAASDILRWLSPVYSLGVYSDFDVVIDTTKLPPTISVEAPILLKIGSIKIPIMGLPKDELESITLNNDSIAVVGNDPLANKEIQKIQQGICNAYLDPEIYTESIGKIFTDVCLYVNKQIHDVRTGISVATHITEQLPDNIFLLGLAGGLGLIKPDPIALRKTILNETIPDSLSFREDAGAIKDAFRKAISDPSTSAAKKEKSIKYLEFPDAELIEVLNEGSRQELIKKSVMHTTGPMSIMLGLFKHCAVSQDTLNQEIKPYSFQHYELNGAFFSKNHSDFHTDPQTILEEAYVKVGDHGDESWLKEGASVVIKREEKMHQAATTIQKIVRGNQSRKKTKAFFQDSKEQDSSASTSGPKSP